MSAAPRKHTGRKEAVTVRLTDEDGNVHEFEGQGSWYLRQNHGPRPQRVPFWQVDVTLILDDDERHRP